MVRLVDDLIDVSRISRNRLELRKERVDFASIINQAVEVSRPAADSSNHTLNISVPQEPILLSADAVRLTQVFSNLLTNACKYTDPGGQIWLTVERVGDEVVTKVKDSGIGIPHDKLNEVFEMFTQIDRTLERTQGGLGIGLTLVKRLVEMHDGIVTAHSEGRGKGSEFVVRLPIRDELVVDATVPAIEPSQVQSRRILVVDDNVDSARTLSMLLKLTGNEVQTAHDGEEAVQKAERYRPDLILLDIGLPKLNGYAACHAIRETDWGKAIHIVALTGWGQEEDRRKSKEAGFDDHVVKPVNHATLAKILASPKRN
jgi:CheY-like chemotaxis protein/two-component sensor histidine kinase